MEFKYFKLEDFNCQETGENKMNVEFIHRLDELREACGFPFIITSGYRSPSHSIEARKEKPGTHAKGYASDIKTTSGSQRYKIIEQAFLLGFSGIGVARNFIHVDDRAIHDGKAPVAWCY
jgi:uncharacterized protein YcbK (DUF882 family)